MKVIATKVWEEPAVCIGLLVTLGLLIANLIGNPDWSVQSIVAILAPLASSLGIRQLVEPTHGEPKPTGTTYHPPPKAPA